MPYTAHTKALKVSFERKDAFGGASHLITASV